VSERESGKKTQHLRHKKRVRWLKGRSRRRNTRKFKGNEGKKKCKETPNSSSILLGKLTFMGQFVL
jgi:hypothetical protein